MEIWRLFPENVGMFRLLFGAPYGPMDISTVRLTRAGGSLRSLNLVCGGTRSTNPLANSCVSG